MEMKADIEGDKSRQYTQFSKIYIQRHVNVRCGENLMKYNIVLYRKILLNVL